MLIEGFEYVAQAIQFGLPFEAATLDGRGGYLRLRVGEPDAFYGFFLHPVVVHVDGFEYAF